MKKNKSPIPYRPDLQAKQVAWYRRHGKFPAARIVKDKTGAEFVIGDWSWNRMGHVQQEIIEPQMDATLSPTEHGRAISGEQW